MLLRKQAGSDQLLCSAQRLRERQHLELLRVIHDVQSGNVAMAKKQCYVSAVSLRRDMPSWMDAALENSAHFLLVLCLVLAFNARR
jgi:hypothetical protein